MSMLLFLSTILYYSSRTRGSRIINHNNSDNNNNNNSYNKNSLILSKTFCWYHLKKNHSTLRLTHIFNTKNKTTILKWQERHMSYVMHIVSIPKMQLPSLYFPRGQFSCLISKGTTTTYPLEQGRHLFLQEESLSMRVCQT